MPGSFLSRYSPVPGRSVAPSCVTRYCSGERFAIASASLVHLFMGLLLLLAAAERQRISAGAQLRQRVIRELDAIGQAGREEHERPRSRIAVGDHGIDGDRA